MERDVVIRAIIGLTNRSLNHFRKTVRESVGQRHIFYNLQES